MLEELAGLLGGAVGGSRVVTSLGWRPHADQIGQTGLRIAPDLYIACGISGAIQHIVGCKAAKRILAINTDPEAPIIRRATYAVIGDVQPSCPRSVTRSGEYGASADIFPALHSPERRAAGGGATAKRWRFPMGFIRGVIAGVTVAAGAAAWYMSRAGAKFRDRYRVDRKLGEIRRRGRGAHARRARASRRPGGRRTGSGDWPDGGRARPCECPRRRARDRMMDGPADDVALKLDEAQAAAAEEAAEIAASVEEKAAKIRKTAKAAEADAEG